MSGLSPSLSKPDLYRLSHPAMDQANENQHFCKAVTKSGKECRAPRLNGSDYCFFHDPERVEERRISQSRGGLAKLIRTELQPVLDDVPVQSAADIVTLLGGTINDVRTGRIDPRIANAVGFLAGVALKAIEQAEIEEKITELGTAMQGREWSTLAEPFG